ncbi:MAG: hypothetical protein CUN53_03645 [Phototrophicales bacterium]|nr:MAG: hypothetical protein CUN53_03645 [Phototrophicales bacterium]
MITSPEWRRLAALIALTLLITTIPYTLATRHDGFSGFVFGVEDGNSYLGKMRLGMRGELAFSLFYTPEMHDSAPLINLPYLLTGWIVGRFIGESSADSHGALIGAFHAFRWLADALLLMAIYRFIAMLIDDPARRFAALILAAFGGGVGWLLALTGAGDLFGSLPADLYIPEGFSFQVLFGLPHLALARAALLTGFVVLIAHKSALLAGLCWLLVGVIVPFYLAVIYAVLGAYGLLRWLRERRFPLDLAIMGGIAALIAAPALVYNAVVFASNPAFGVWSAQNILPSPHPLHYLFAYGLMGALAIIGAWAARCDPRWTLALAWIAIVPILVYLPINVQRRLAEGVIVPLAALAAVGLFHWLPKRGRLRALIIGGLSLTAGFLWIGGLFTAITPRPPAFIDPAYAAAFIWLNSPSGANVRADDVILAAVPTGNALPAYVRARVYMGHGPETLFWQDKTRTVEAFFSGSLSDAARATLFDPPCPLPERELCLLPVNYVIAGDNERAFGAESAWAEGLALIYDAAGVRIYATNP